MSCSKTGRYINSCFVLLISAVLLMGCSPNKKEGMVKGIDLTAKDILGNPKYLAMSYGGYRGKTREEVPTVEDLKEDMKILSAMGIKLLRTYNTQLFGQTPNLLKAIRELKTEDPKFEMYIMLGAWIQCSGAFTDEVNHSVEDLESNTREIEKAIEMVNEYPDIIKIIAVGNESMVHWALTYFVEPAVVLNWVNYLQELKADGKIPTDTWITSSDNYESWGGGSTAYHKDELAQLIDAVDFVSLHTYPFHDSYYNPSFWGAPEEDKGASALQRTASAMERAGNYAISQYQGAVDYMNRLGLKKPIHIGETGWATVANTAYGLTGSQAADEYKEKSYYDFMRDWTNKNTMSCFFFEAFNEPWKDDNDVNGSENHFGLFTVGGKAKYVLWDAVDQGVFEGLTRNGNPITKTYGGNEASLMMDLLIPPLSSQMGLFEISDTNPDREAGELVTEENYILANTTLQLGPGLDFTYPSTNIKVNSWEGSCTIEMSREGIIQLTTGTGEWWGAGLEIQGNGENMTRFEDGYLNFEIRGTTNSRFDLGFQTGRFGDGTQVNNFVTFGNDLDFKLDEKWGRFSLAISTLNKGADLTDVTGLLYIRGETDFDGKTIELRNIYYSR